METKSISSELRCETFFVCSTGTMGMIGKRMVSRSAANAWTSQQLKAATLRPRQICPLVGLDWIDGGHPFRLHSLLLRQVGFLVVSDWIDGGHPFRFHIPRFCQLCVLVVSDWVDGGHPARNVTAYNNSMIVRWRRHFNIVLTAVVTVSSKRNVSEIIRYCTALTQSKFSFVHWMHH